jgi:hypothetical protein
MSTTTAVTPYAAAKFVNAKLAEAGIEKVLPPQMFYNYTTARIRAGKNALIACVTDEAGKTMIEQAALETWLEKYIAKNV